MLYVPIIAFARGAGDLYFLKSWQLRPEHSMAPKNGGGSSFALLIIFFYVL